MTTRTHRRAANIALAVVAALMVLAAHKTLDGLNVAAIPNLPAWLLLVPTYMAGHVMGRAKQRRAHAWAVWKGHPR